MDMQAVREAVGARMEAAARAHGWGVRQVARALDEAETTIRLWWKGVRLPPAEKFDRYAALFGQEAGYFYGEHLAARIEEAELGISPALWAQLEAPDRQAIRSQALAWALLRGLSAAEPTAPTTDGSPPEPPG